MRALALVAVVGVVAPAAAAPPPRATFALIVGVNQSVDRDQPLLHYADDDAVLYFELFRALGAKSYLVSRLDDETRRLHPQAADGAVAPIAQSLERSVAQLAGDVVRARAEGRESVLYVVYAGHGNIQGGQGYVVLEDRRLFGRDLDRIFGEVGAGQNHLIVDACYSFFLAFDRGPGGRRRALPAAKLPTLALGDGVGLLLSTSSARESHEWQGFQSGIFSYEVRSGLYGAADIDGDGSISYREIAAFVESANAPIPNSRYRPEIFARPPKGQTTLLDLRPGLDSHVELPEGGHYVIESGDGVRQVELHRDDETPIRLLRPLPSQTLFVRRTDDNTEYRLPAAATPVRLAELPTATSRIRVRGAAHEAFSSIFSRPFGVPDVVAYRFISSPDFSAFERRERRLVRMRAFGGTFLGLSVAAVAVGAGFTSSAVEWSQAPPAGTSQAEVAHRNQQAGDRNLTAGLLYGAAGTLALGGALLLLLPKLPRLSVALGPSNSSVLWRGEF